VFVAYIIKLNTLQITKARREETSLSHRRAGQHFADFKISNRPTNEWIQLQTIS